MHEQSIAIGTLAKVTITGGLYQSDASCVLHLSILIKKEQRREFSAGLSLPGNCSRVHCHLVMGRLADLV